jgi:hypothetical protein
MIKQQAAARIGATDEDIAAYLPGAGLVTGSDLLIDGGVIADLWGSQTRAGALTCGSVRRYGPGRCQAAGS